MRDVAGGREQAGDACVATKHVFRGAKQHCQANWGVYSVLGGQNQRARAHLRSGER